MLGGNFMLAGRPVFFALILFGSFCVFLFFPSPFLIFDICYRIEKIRFILIIRVVCIKYTQYMQNTHARAFITLVNSTNLVYPLNRFLTLCAVSVQFMDQAPILKDIRAS